MWNTIVRHALARADRSIQQLVMHVWSRHDELDRLPGDRLVRRIGQLDHYLVRARGKPDDDERFVAGIDGWKGLTIHVIVQMPDARRDAQRRLVEDWQDA